MIPQTTKAALLTDISLTISDGEFWAVLGEAGAGKSPLAHIIAGDNPQAYANEIWLFDRKRGSGESIWDIKKKIGFISPELQLYSVLGGTCLEVALSGMTDSLGTKRIRRFLFLMNHARDSALPGPTISTRLSMKSSGANKKP